MAHLVVARDQPSGNITFGIFLVDILCLGLKDVIYHFNIPEFEYLDLRKEMTQALDAEPCSYELAHNIIYGAVEFAHDLGFKAHRNWSVAQYLLAEDNEDIEFMDLQFGGEDGRPCVVVSPEDSMRSVAIS